MNRKRLSVNRAEIHITDNKDVQSLKKKNRAETESRHACNGKTERPLDMIGRQRKTKNDTKKPGRDKKD